MFLRKGSFCYNMPYCSLYLNKYTEALTLCLIIKYCIADTQEALCLKNYNPQCYRIKELNFKCI